MGKGSNAPPPVNRAEKPKLVSTPVGDARKPSLQADTAIIDDRVSPFSTPPSSDENGEQPKHNGLDRIGRKPESQQAARAREGYLSPPPKRADTWSSQAPVVKVSEGRRLPSDRKMSGMEVAASDEPNARPGLPVRTQAKKADTQLAPSQPVDTLMQKTAVPLDYDVMKSTSNSSFVSSGARNAQREFLPPPKRTNFSSTPRPEQPPRPSVPYSTRPITEAQTPDDLVNVLTATASNSNVYPDASNVNRRPPTAKDGVRKIEVSHDTRLFDIWRNTLSASGSHTRAWNINTGEMIAILQHSEGGTRVTAMAFKAASSVDKEGQVVWLGNNYGELQEVDLSRRGSVVSHSRVHGGREIIRIYRHQNSMWTLDEDGKLYIWSSETKGVPDLQSSPTSHRLQKGHTFSLIVQNKLWFACGRDIRVFQPGQSGDNPSFTSKALTQASAGEVTSGTTIPGQFDRVYFGHADGKVSIYSTSTFAHLGTVTISVYRINALVGVGSYLWAGFNTGTIFSYDTRTQPWLVKKDWQAHRDPVVNIVVDRSSLWMTGTLQVASIGADHAIRMWEGTLEDDILEDDMQNHDTEFCTFEEIETLVVTWNAGACTPGDLRYEDKDSNFFRKLLQDTASPDIIVFGFQELVDLEDKKLTAMSLFKGNKRKDPSEQEHMSRQYRAWRDHLVRCIEDTMPFDESYSLLHTASMVGLFSCIFIRSSLRARVSRTSHGEVKRGMGGLHGNKVNQVVHRCPDDADTYNQGALIYRFVLDDSSLCFINCHLAAGQTQTMNRNNDVSAILESVVLASEYDTVQDGGIFTGGGDGSMVLDHEICVLNGDLNYRIDTMSRDIVIKAIQLGNFPKLLDRDQLLVSRRRNPGFRLRAFMESPITFAPTYKYDVGTDRYDTSEKHRAPAWCDRILYKGAGKVKQLDYRRHEMRASDHRPVTATFKMRIKKIIPEERERIWQAAQQRLKTIKQQLTYDAK